MSVTSVAKLKKIKNRRCLVVSCGGSRGGIQCLYFSSNGQTWEILAHSKISYPQKVISILEIINSCSFSGLTPSDLGYLDFKVSQLMLECVKTTLAQTSRSVNTPHAVIINKMTLWKGLTEENCQQRYWDISAGDPQLIASSLNIPVFSDFARNNLLAGGPGAIPVNPGNRIILSKCPGITMFLNIGIFSQLTIIDTSRPAILADSITGPGTCLIDRVAKSILEVESFDRDGNLASKGNVDGELLNTLASAPWFTQSGMKTAASGHFDYILNIPEISKLSPHDRIATITALTARSIYNYYRTEYKESNAPDRILISGGGANNLTIQEYLRTYFQTIPIASIETLSIPVDMRIPFALGLTVNASISGATVPFDNGTAPKVTSIGRWYYP
jgi:anhydro-N-acetylmuramic acid kinase